MDWKQVSVCPQVQYKECFWSCISPDHANWWGKHIMHILSIIKGSSPFNLDYVYGKHTIIFFFFFFVTDFRRYFNGIILCITMWQATLKSQSLKPDLLGLYEGAMTGRDSERIWQAPGNKTPKFGNHILPIWLHVSLQPPHSPIPRHTSTKAAGQPGKQPIWCNKVANRIINPLLCMFWMLCMRACVCACVWVYVC